MTGWTYHTPDGSPARGARGRPWELETVGARELELMLRARSASSHSLILPHDREHNADRLAARRLCLRELLTWPNYMGGGLLFGRKRLHLYRYNLTKRGRECWLRVRGEQ